MHPPFYHLITPCEDVNLGRLLGYSTYFTVVVIIAHDPG